MSISGIVSWGFDLARAYEFRVCFGLFPLLKLEMEPDTQIREQNPLYAVRIQQNDVVSQIIG